MIMCYSQYFANKMLQMYPHHRLSQVCTVIHLVFCRLHANSHVNYRVVINLYSKSSLTNIEFWVVKCAVIYQLAESNGVDNKILILTE
jgi:hypothetical protein